MLTLAASNVKNYSHVQDRPIRGEKQTFTFHGQWLDLLCVDTRPYPFDCFDFLNRPGQNEKGRDLLTPQFRHWPGHSEFFP
jgi:hypothetical protein